MTIENVIMVIVDSHISHLLLAEDRRNRRRRDRTSDFLLFALTPQKVAQKWRRFISLSRMTCSENFNYKRVNVSGVAS